MRILFRVDASLSMGSGHVMRCLTLARALLAQGHRCVFVSREHPGNLNAVIQGHGFELHSLPMGCSQDTGLQHSHWLGSSQDEDIRISRSVIDSFRPTWLVVDHYALDQRWEEAVTPTDCRLLVIDDLADRLHACDVLLDQNLGRCVADYQPLVPAHCKILAGPLNAVLRPEFAELRKISLARRREARLRKVLVTLGGVDQYNHTGAILDALRLCELPDAIHFTVVMGGEAPHLAAVQRVASTCPWPVEVLCGIGDMAQRMVDADLAIGAAGGTSWERCCLGLPTLLVIIAENQRSAGHALESVGAVQLIDLALPLTKQLQSAFMRLGNGEGLQLLGSAAAQIVDGRGVERILEVMELQA
ncbi:UDP-2,4-diacetamido-2,4,6-trideoxy-beta-L-altropyranose hydrolase [compost metagenome]